MTPKFREIESAWIFETDKVVIRSCFFTGGNRKCFSFKVDDPSPACVADTLRKMADAIVKEFAQ